MPKCTWLVEVATATLFPPEAEWYPDSPGDVYTIVDCGDDATHREGTLCEYHNSLMEMPELEFEAMTDEAYR